MPEAAYDFHLPAQLIAQHPPKRREDARLLCVDDGIHPFSALPRLLRRGDVLVFNTSKVLPARLFGHKDSGGKMEILLERLLDRSTCLTQLGTARAPRQGSTLHTAGGVFVVGARQGAFTTLHAVDVRGRPAAVQPRFVRHGHTPLPPYIRRPAAHTDRRRYQTVYAQQPGSVAAPTAGLHFSKRLLTALSTAGIHSAFLHLHVGAGTFMPLRAGQTTLHSESYAIPAATARAITRAKQQGRRVIAVGTTTLRALEAAAMAPHSVRSGQGETNLFIRPGYAFRIADALITNFHLPKSSLFMLVCAFGGTARLHTAYAQAIAARLRFYSYGDAMLLPAA